MKTIKEKENHKWTWFRNQQILKSSIPMDMPTAQLLHLLLREQSKKGVEILWEPEYRKVCSETVSTRNGFIKQNEESQHQGTFKRYRGGFLGVSPLDEELQKLRIAVRRISFSQGWAITVYPMQRSQTWNHMYTNNKNGWQHVLCVHLCICTHTCVHLIIIRKEKEAINLGGWLWKGVVGCC